MLPNFLQPLPLQDLVVSGFSFIHIGCVTRAMPWLTIWAVSLAPSRANRKPSQAMEICRTNLRKVLKRWNHWRRYLAVDSLTGICGNLFTTLMTCLLAYALLFPKGLLPNEYELAVVQSRFFEVSWGYAGRILFLIVAAAFLTDTWLATADAVSRMQADIVHILFPKSRRFELRHWYYFFFGCIDRDYIFYHAARCAGSTHSDQCGYRFYWYGNFPRGALSLEPPDASAKSPALGAPPEDISVSPCRFFSGLSGAGRCLSLGNIISKVSQYLIFLLSTQSTGKIVQYAHNFLVY